MRPYCLWLRACILSEVKMASLNNDLMIKVKFNYEISLWQAIKLRIAGKNYRVVADEVLKLIKERIDFTPKAQS